MRKYKIKPLIALNVLYGYIGGPPEKTIIKTQFQDGYTSGVTWEEDLSGNVIRWIKDKK